MNKVVEVNHIVKNYDQSKVLNEIDMEVIEGEFLAIMGPSGSGKTTLLNIISTIDKADAGKIVVDGIDTTSIKEKELANFRRDVIGFVFQEFNLLDNMTVRDNIALPLTLNDVNHKFILKRVDELTNLLGINIHLDKYPYELSGGQKQRAAICRALVASPKILLADEPTGALDSKASSDVLECFKRINKELNTTIVMVTHDATAASYCDRILFIKDGNINGQINSNGNKKEVLKQVLNMLEVLGASENEFI